jgi:hypothetical protein
MILARHRRSMQPKRKHPITKEVLRQLKRPRCFSIVDRLVILPIDALIDVSVLLLHHTSTDLKLLQMQTKFEDIKSATIVDRMVTSLNRAPTHVLVFLWHRHLLQHHYLTRKPRKGRKYIQKMEDGYDPNLDSYYVEDYFPKDRSRDWVIKLVF